MTTHQPANQTSDYTAALSRALPRLRPYQAVIARAILRRIETGEGGSISVEIARQGGKNELSAQVELISLLARARRGGTIIKAAPTDRPQARLSFERLRRRAADAGLDGLVESEGGNIIRCGRASARFLSAEPTANVVGHTADLLLEVDEAQDVRVGKFERDFRPMAASTNAPVVFYGTPWGAGTLLEQAKARHLEAERAGAPRAHFRFDWEQVAAHVPAYGDYVASERARLGERHPLFRTQYLLETLEDQDRLFDRAALAQLEGEHHRLAGAQPGERYVAGLDLAGPDLPAEVGTLPAAEATPSRDRDWTVLTIVRVTDDEDRGASAMAPTIEVVEHIAERGTPTDALIARLADTLTRVWRVRAVAVDATGLGGPMTDQLVRRLPRSRVLPVVFTTERKSQLGFGLLAAAHSGRLRLYRGDGSRDAIEVRRQLALARVAYRDRRTMQFYVDPADGHDDYLVSLALAVAATRTDGAPRLARGRPSRLQLVGASTSPPAPRAQTEVAA